MIVSSKIDKELRLEFIDIPNLHTYTDEGAEEFFMALSNTEKMEIFNIKAVRMMIDFKWPLAKSYTIWRLFVPFIFFLGFYLVYMNIVYYKRNLDANWIFINQIFIGFLCFFCLYFINNERRQLMAEGFDYLKSIWNYLDLIPPILLLIFIPFEFVGMFDNGQNATLEACL